ncbi:MAG: SDR family NAD(P)-dependent oxidoreductase [Clostridia bacterium]|jgi:short-subunit dehydrogenase|nr:SDR family NAD(P)-dependent oxidoreductase [Clostridia bacterium]MCI8944817.1 SDR family NAD(P)-dependent oxidoreductase [Clostridia bacterium]MCI9290858.1 SDR family NAD(P)-dependent oxidoreductase [Clostridia bacterium]
MTKKWLYGRNVVLTGCSTGMGKEVLMILVKKYGCNVMGVARNKAKLDELKEQLGDKFSYRRFNISSLQDWKDFAAELEGMGFMTDILINNAGMIQPFGQYNDLTDDQIKKVVDTNLMSVVYGCKAMLPTIKKSKYGYICNVASASAILPVGGESIYSATKGGVWALTECLAQELKGFGIGVSCVMPGPVKTDIYKAREGESGPKADSLVESIGITAYTAGKKIVKAIRKGKVRVIPDAVAGLMDFGMRVCPSFTCKATGSLIKKFSPKIASFKPIYAEQIERKSEIKQMKKQRKKSVYKKLEQVPEGAFKNDDVSQV